GVVRAGGGWCRASVADDVPRHRRPHTSVREVAPDGSAPRCSSYPLDPGEGADPDNDESNNPELLDRVFPEQVDHPLGYAMRFTHRGDRM
ncbi:hypothetical protein ACFVXQ_22605, partial [Kitasatospora sp. NPDC058263]